MQDARRDGRTSVKTGRVAHLGLQMALEAGGLGTLEWDIPSGRLTWSETLERMHGLAPGTFEGTREAFERHIHPDDRALVRKTIDSALETKDEFQITYRIVPVEGPMVCVEARGTVVTDDDGRPLRMIGVCLDVSERARANTALQVLAEVSDTLTSSMGLEESLDAVIHLMVPRVADWCALDLVDGEQLTTVARAHTAPDHEDALLRFLADTAAQSGPHGLLEVWRSGRPLLVPIVEAGRGPLSTGHEMPGDVEPQSLIRVPFSIGNDIAGILTMAATQMGHEFDDFDLRLATQITRRIALAVGHARYYRDAQRAIRMRDEVLAIVSHDLRNPLNTIHMASSVLREELGASEACRRLDAIDRAVERSHALIRDLLDVACLHTGGLKIEPLPCSPQPLLDEVRTIFTPQAEDESIDLRIRVPDADSKVLADRDRIVQVLSNLVANALQHTPERGQIEIGAHVDTGRGQCVFWVHDSGPGVNLDQRSRLFEPFWQARKLRRGGAGLGLAIARGLVDAHGGHIWVDTDVERGARFCFTLPLAEMPDIACRHEDPRSRR